MEFSLFLSPSLGFTKEEKNIWHEKMRRIREKIIIMIILAPIEKPFQFLAIDLSISTHRDFVACEVHMACNE
jgi:hypothetical protein